MDRRYTEKTAMYISGAEIQRWLRNAAEYGETVLTLIISGTELTLAVDGTPDQLMALFKDSEQEEPPHGY